MPADYQKIREENIARYGWDTAVLDLLGHLYSDRTHFIFELIQNAEDAGATRIDFDVHDDRLEVRHDGRPFTEADVRGICGVASSGKDLTSIGKFGIGFKAVYAYTTSPRVYSGDEAFRIENYVRPHAIDPLGNDDTLFVFPLDNPADAAEIRAAIRALDPDAFLFLKNIKHQNRRWRVFQRAVGAHHVEIAFRAEPAIAACARSPLYVYLPTQKETFLGFLVQGPYRTTPARDNVGEQDPDNQALVRETASLLRDALRVLRDEALLTVDALAALPIDPARFPRGSFFRPLFDAARDALATEELIPVAGGGYAKAAALRLASDPELRELFGAGFVPGPLAPGLYDYLRDEVGIAEVSAAELAGDVTAEFLAEQSDEWLVRFYRYILRDLDTWRSRPVIRLEDGSHVLPSAAYLPAPRSYPEPGSPRPGSPRPGFPERASGFPTVRRAIAANPSARALLDALGLTTPDVVDEVLRLVLPRKELDDADLALIMRAIEEAPPARRRLLDEALQRTAFLVGENAASGEERLLCPGELYFRSQELEVYFGGNPDVWFAADRYGPWRRQLREMGVRENVRVRARRPDLSGHVLLADEFARHERGLDGFDPDAWIDGLEFALGHASHARSEYVWNAVLAPNHRLIAGIVEKSVRDAFVDATRESTGSAISEAARREAWLPAPDGSFRRPAELSLADLPATFAQDENLARTLGMAQPTVAQAARQLGIPASVLWGLSAHPDLVATIEYELKMRAHNRDT